MYTIKGKYTSALITNDEIEEQCINQINSMINHVAFDNPVVIQVDAHAGKGSVVGFTMPLGTKVIPQTIGVDIGCAVLSANIGDKTAHPISTPIVLGQNRRRPPNAAEVKPTELFACIGHRLASVALGNHDHAAAVGLETIHIGIHAPGGRRTE